MASPLPKHEYYHIEQWQESKERDRGRRNFCNFVSVSESMRECISHTHMFSFSSPHQDLGIILN